MKIKRSEPFEVFLAETVKILITRVTIDDGKVYFEVSSEEKYHGRIFPALNDSYELYWRTVDDIEEQFVYELGKQIDFHDM
jgi:hypothetical protein